MSDDNEDRGIAAMSEVVQAMADAGLGESLQDRLDQLGAEAEAGEADQSVGPIPRGTKVTGPGYVSVSSEQEMMDVAREMSNEETLATPVRFEIDGNEMATLTFGPMSLFNLESMLTYLGTEDGSASFRAALAAQFEEGFGQEG